MKKLTTLLAAAGIISGCFVFAQDAPSVPQRRERGPRTERMRPPYRNDQRENVEAKLKEKYPAEFAEIEKLRNEAEIKLQVTAAWRTWCTGKESRSVAAPQPGDHAEKDDGNPCKISEGI